MSPPTLSPPRDTSRREFLQVSVAAAGGLLVACRALGEPPKAPAEKPAAPGAGTSAPVAEKANGPFGVYLEITPDNRVFITTPQTEMGQGVHDALPKILADELDADWSRVSVRLPYADDGFVNPTTKRQRTANSESVLIYFEPLRRVGATAREMLVSAAAARWNVPASECASGHSQVTHAASGRALGYGELAAAAAALPPPAAPRLKSPSEWTLIGVSTPRKDTPGKCDGSARFGIDVRLPGMLYASLRRSPAVRSSVVSFDRDAALRLPGVVDAFAIADGVAVIADSTWRARRAAESLVVKFDESAAAPADQKTIEALMQAALSNDQGALPGRAPPSVPAPNREATQAALDGAARRIEFAYEVPFLAHAALEPLSCTAWVREDSCEVWAPSQNADQAHAAVVQITGLPRERVRLNITLAGGGFGRKWELDFIRQAVEIARHARNRPVKLTWTREQDFQHDRYRPAHRVRTRVGLGRDGTILAMHSRIAGINMWKYQGRPLAPGFGDPFATGGLIDYRYGFPNTYVDFAETELPIPVGTWRSVSLSMNGFFSESVVNDLAALDGTDPWQYRRARLANYPRAVAVLDAAAKAAGWETPLPKGRGRGIAITFGFESISAQVVEVTVTGRRVKVDRIVCAFDCGTVIDPHNVEAQIEGGIVWGLSAALNGEISFADGAALQTNFHQAPILTLAQMPRIEVHLIASGAKPSGAGEAGVPPVAPALAAAVRAACGRPVRRLPLIRSGFELA